MALIDFDRVTLVYSDGQSFRTALYSLKNVNAGDTAELQNEFTIVKRAGLVSSTGTHILACTIAGTVITIPAGPAADGLWLLAVGVAK
jgi:uncharacterized membrane protein